MTKAMRNVDVNRLYEEYRTLAPLANRFRLTIKEQCEQLLSNNDIPLGVPIESRIKSWESISDKLGSNLLHLTSISDLSDLIGLRVILLFLRDVDKTCQLLNTHFTVLDQENTQERLDTNQFGYQSVHYLVELPESWLTVPSLSGFAKLTAEIQVRTVAQHIWAAASHVLQYKKESSVPPPVQRAIHRVSALLETVDIELETVLEDREKYREWETPIKGTTNLNVDLLERVLDSALPMANRHELERYGDSLSTLTYFDVHTVDDLTNLFDSELSKALETEAEAVETAGEVGSRFTDSIKVRKSKHVYFTHMGLINMMLNQKNAKRFRKYYSGLRNKNIPT